MARTTNKNSAEIVAKIIALNASGSTQKEISQSMNLGLNTIGEILNDKENQALVIAAQKTLKERLINNKLEQISEAFIKNCETANSIIDKNLRRLDNGVANLIPKEIQAVAIIMDIAHKNLRLARGESTENVSQNVRHFSFEQMKQGEVIDAPTK